MDLSDGLADGLRQVAEASGVGIAIDAQALPIDRDVMGWFEHHCADPAIAAVCGGDDYELMFTVRPAHRGRLRAVKRLLGDLPITKIGVVTKGREVVMRTAAGEQPLPRGFDHFIK
jgi:thiamine-monophosphate kinase